jgi:hypothetical protein
MLPLRFSNSSNIASCLLLMARSTEHSTVSKIIATSKTIRINVVERNMWGLKPHSTFITFPIRSLEGKGFSPFGKFFSH